MGIQVSLQPADTKISNRKSDKTSHHKSHSIPDIAPVRRYQRSQKRNKAKCCRRDKCSVCIIEIIHENNLRIEQKQNKISCCQTRINLQHLSSESISRKDDHTDEIYHNRNNKLDTYQIQKFRCKLPEHPVLGVPDVPPSSAGDSLRIRFVSSVEMHLHTGYKDDRRRDVRKHRDTRRKIIRGGKHKTVRYHHS